MELGVVVGRRRYEFDERFDLRVRGRVALAPDRGDQVRILFLKRIDRLIAGLAGEFRDLLVDALDAVLDFFGIDLFLQ